MFEKIITYIQDIFQTKEFIPLHQPTFIGNEKKYLIECIDSTYVSSVGKFVDRFEEMCASYTGTKNAIVTVNGTEALHLALIINGVKQNDEVLTQPLTFIATANAISYIGAKPVFVDVDKDTMGLSPIKVEEFLTAYADIRNDGFCYNKKTGNRIAACVPMHTFGHPVKLDELQVVCNKYNIPIIEDAAESLGSYYKGRHTGTFGNVGTLSFNGNKTITTGGGGMILTNDDALGKYAKHLTTQAKLPHQWEFVHDQIGYNFRMPNINAALGCAQMEKLTCYIEKKRILAENYNQFFDEIGIQFFKEPEHCKSNYWLNSVIFENRAQRDAFLEYSNKHKVMTRPVWQLMNYLPMFKNCTKGPLENAEWFSERVVNIPSSVIL
jgi:aminotransferase in exopolysaccharide biosynthesis